MTRAQRLAAMRAGRHASLNGLPVTACPYRQDTAEGRALASAWVREYVRNNPAAIEVIRYG